MFTFTYEFEELPLVVECGFDAGLISGSALISVHELDDWYIKKVFLDGFRKKHNASGFDRKPIEVDYKSWIFLAICDQLDGGKFKQYVEDAIAKEYDGLRDQAADQRRERMRDDNIGYIWRGD